MFATFVCRNSVSITKSAVTAGIHLTKLNGPFDIIVRRMANSPVRSGKIRKAQRTRSLGEIAIAPAGKEAFRVGEGVAIGASALGLAALCFYGLGFRTEPGVINTSKVWPQYVKDRIKTSFTYFGCSLFLIGASTVACLCSPIMNAMMRHYTMALLGLAAIRHETTELIVKNPQGMEGKGAVLALHSIAVGALIALLGGPILMRLALCTVGIGGGLAAVAAGTPSDKLLTVCGPMTIGFGAVFAASLGSMFLTPTTAMKSGLSIPLPGWLVLYSGYLLFKTQLIFYNAERCPKRAQFDPIIAMIGIYGE